MILKFLNKKNEEIEIIKSSDKENINKAMNDYLNKIKFKSYYTRINFENEKRIIIDYGSHSEFFIVESENDKENMFEIFGLRIDKLTN